MSRTGDIARQQSSYRRGLVLGLTVAESMLLILFALLLALGWVLVKRDRTALQLQQRIAGLEHEERLVQAKLDVISSIAQHRPTEEFFKELVQAREAQAQVKLEEQRLVERERATEKMERLLGALQNSPDAKARLRDLAANGARLEQALAKVSKDAGKADPYDAIPEGVALAQAAKDAGRSPEETRAMLRDAERSAREAATLKGQVVRLRSELRSVGKGGDYPPCWITEKGEIQYLFDIALNGDGTLAVKDVTPPARLSDRRDLPIPQDLLQGLSSRGRFLAATEGLLALEKAKGCRFYVIARDRTSASQKDLFKSLLFNTVEARFYKVQRP